MRAGLQVHTFAVPVQDVQGCDEELVGILLLVACEVPGVSPHQVQQLVRDVGRPVPRVKLLREKANEITCQGKMLPAEHKDTRGSLPAASNVDSLG